MFGYMDQIKSYCCDIWIIGLFSKVPVDELKKEKNHHYGILVLTGTFIVTIFSTKSLVATINVTRVK